MVLVSQNNFKKVFASIKICDRHLASLLKTIKAIKLYLYPTVRSNCVCVGY